MGYRFEIIFNPCTGHVYFLFYLNVTIFALHRLNVLSCVGVSFWGFHLKYISRKFKFIRGFILDFSRYA